MDDNQPPERGRINNQPGHGVLFVRKSEGRQPHFEGGINLGGTEYRLAAWKAVSKKGVEYISPAIDQRPRRGERNR